MLLPGGRSVPGELKLCPHLQVPDARRNSASANTYDAISTRWSSLNPAGVGGSRNAGQVMPPILRHTVLEGDELEITFTLIFCPRRMSY